MFTLCPHRAYSLLTPNLSLCCCVMLSSDTFSGRVQSGDVGAGWRAGMGGAGWRTATLSPVTCMGQCHWGTRAGKGLVQAQHLAGA